MYSPAASPESSSEKLLAYFQRSDVTLTDSLIETCSRAGIASFGGAAAMGSAALDRSGIVLAAQDYAGVSPTFQDRSGNRCGCGEQKQPCRVLSTAIEPPEPAGTFGRPPAGPNSLLFASNRRLIDGRGVEQAVAWWWLSRGLAQSTPQQ